MTNKKRAIKKGKEFKAAGVDHVTAMRAGKMCQHMFSPDVAEFLEGKGYKVDRRDFFGDDHVTVYTVNGVEL